MEKHLPSMGQAPQLHLQHNTKKNLKMKNFKNGQFELLIYSNGGIMS
jgi:hypothetical protein